MLGARLFGAPVLFSAQPISREDVPHALANKAAENHAGLILSYLPLKGGHSPYRLVKDMFQMTGTNPTPAEFCAEKEIRCPETPIRHQMCPASPEEAGLFYAQTPEGNPGGLADDGDTGVTMGGM